MGGDGQRGRRSDAPRLDSAEVDTLDGGIGHAATPDDDDEWLDDEPTLGAAYEPATAGPAGAAYDYDDDDDEYDGYGDGYDGDGYELDDEYGETTEGYEPAWLAPASAVARTAPVAEPAPPRPPPTPAADPAIWAPGTAPGAWVPLGRPRFGNPIPPPVAARVETRTRRRNLSVFSLAGITNVLLLSYGVTAALLAAFTAALGRRRAALQDVVTDEARVDALRRSAHLVDVTSLGVVALIVATTAASMVWSGVAARNQRMLGDRDSAPSPALAVLGWVLPVVNLVLPLRAMSDLGAGPFAEAAPPGNTVRWWASWVASVISCGYALYAAVSTGDADLPKAITRLTLAAVVATVCFLYCFSQASTLFREIARRQHDLAVERD